MILITGAAGFIGSHIVSSLAAQHGEFMHCMDIADMGHLNRFKTCPMNIDITDVAAMDDAVKYFDARHVEGCIHLAAVASPPIAKRDPARAWATNVQGTHNVLELCRRIGCKRFVFFSSAHVYGISPKYMPTDEKHPLALHDIYTTTKIMGEQLCQLFYENSGLSYCTLRLWNAYGPGQNKDYFIGAKLAQAKAGKLTLRNEHVTKDWIHVDDVVRAALMALRSNYVGPLNVGTGIETSLGDIAGHLASAFGVEVERENVPDEGPSRMQCDWGRIKNTLGWEPTRSFLHGLDELIREAKAA